MSYEGPLAEFNALRSEIAQRTGHQQTLFGAQLTLSGAIFAFALSDPSRVPILLILPWIAYAFCAVVTNQGLAIYRMGDYIREELSSRVPGGLHWEEWTQSHPRRRPIIYQLLPSMIVYPGSGIIALVFSFGEVFSGNSALPRPLMIIIWLVDLLLILVSGILIFVGRKGSRPPSWIAWIF